MTLISNEMIKVSDRIECDGYFGTVRYVGEVGNTKGDWIGVEWDDVSRGKHDGCLDGNKYFNTQHPTSGSFIRAHKLKLTKSFTSALKERYTDLFDVPQDVLELPQTSGHNRTITYVGFDKVAQLQSELQKLEEINLGCMQVAYNSGDESELELIGDKLKHVHTLILSKNLLTSWNDVANIVRHIPSLSHLILSHNRLSIPSIDESSRTSSSPLLPCLDTLVIDNLNYNWDHVLHCAMYIWSHVKRLDLWGNKIVHLKQPPTHTFDQLEYLSLCDNEIGSWEEICKIGHLPLLVTLDVSKCAITQIRFNDCQSSSGKTQLFKSLKKLFLTDNKLSHGRDVAELNKLEQLEEILIKGNPVFDSEQYETHFNYTLSRIGKLITLNREKITPNLRRDAEIYYMKHFYKEYTSLKDASDEVKQSFYDQHPRFNQLISTYGALSEEEIDPKLEMEKRRFLTLVFRCPFMDNKQITKKIPSSISIIHLKLLLRKLFSLNIDNDFNLVWTSKDNFSYPLEKETQNLNFYSIENEDVIIINVQ